MTVGGGLPSGSVGQPRCVNLTSGFQTGRSWIDERVLEVAKNGPRKAPMSVKGHSGVEGNELADKRAKDAVNWGQWMSEPSPVTLAGIR